MGTTDKRIRFAIALLVAALYYFNYINGILGIILLAVAIVFALTSFIGFCPLYTLIGFNTKGK